MKTYKTTVEKPRIEIYHDPFASSPREDTNLGYFITFDQYYNSPDKSDWLETVIKDTGEVAKDVNDHMRLIKNRIDEHSDGEKVVAIYPVTKYEHSAVSYSLGSKHGFDYSNNGFYIITDKTQNIIGVEAKDFEKVIKEELSLYTKYVNGEVWGITVYDENGEIQDTCSGFYDIEDMRSGLPEDLKDEKLEDYIIE